MVKALALALLLPALALADTPDLREPVTDPAGLLSEQDRAAVADSLVRLRQDTGVQMAVLLVDTTSGEPIEDYAHRVATAWRGGQQGRDNGLLLVIAVKDRHMRLEVGYGLEGDLPDGATRRLLDAQGPRMRERDYAGALRSIIQDVQERLPLAGSEGSTWRPWHRADLIAAFLFLSVIAAMLGFFVGVIFREWSEMSSADNVLLYIMAGLVIVPAAIASFVLFLNDHALNLLLVSGLQLAAVAVGGYFFHSARFKPLGATIIWVSILGSAVAVLTLASTDVLLLLRNVALYSGLPALVLGGLGLIYGRIKPDEGRSYSSQHAAAASAGSASSGTSSASSAAWDTSSSSSSSWDSSSSSSSSWDSSSSSSSSSDSSWGGGGGDFGGGGSSSSW